jgi:CarD family transcriptional regulator
MFEIGDKIFYPNHGAGVINAIEEKEFLGEKHLYYVLNMFLRELQIMVPVNKMSNLGIRKVVDLDIMENVLAMLQDGEPDLTVNSTQRYRINMDKIMSGDIYEGAEVIRDLTCISRKKVLGSGDKMMLDNAQKLLLSELVLVKGISTEQASHLLHQAINH